MPMLHTGYKRDAAHKRTQKPVGALLAGYGSAAIPDTFSLRDQEGAILDQGPTESCGGAGTSGGLQVAANAAGAPLGFVPSPGGIYVSARSIERAAATVPNLSLPPLQDTGVMPADVMTGLALWGIRPMRGPTADGRNYDLDENNVNDEPVLDDLETSSMKIIAGEYRIEETSSNLVALVKQSLYVARAPVGDGNFVDSSVMNFTATSAPVGTPNYGDPKGGGHWTCIVGYRLEADGTTSVEVLNSWGSSYRDAGHFWGSQSWLESCSDLYSWTLRRAV